MTNFTLSILTLLISSKAMALTKELSRSENIYEVGECARNFEKSGTKTKPQVLYWVMRNSTTGQVSMVYPHYPNEVKISVPPITYTPVHIQKTYFTEIYYLKVRKSITTETAQRKWYFFGTDDSTKKKETKSSDDYEEFESETEFSGDPGKSVEMRQAMEFASKNKCENRRNKLLADLGMVNDPNINDSSRGTQKSPSIGNEKAAPASSGATKQ